MATYSGRDVICSVCQETKKCVVRTDEPKSWEVVTPPICTECKETVVIFPEGTTCGMAIRNGSKPTVSKISGFGRSFEDFDRDYDRMQREGA